VRANLIHHRRRNDLEVRRIRIEPKPTSDLPDLLDGVLEFFDLFIFHKTIHRLHRNLWIPHAGVSTLRLPKNCFKAGYTSSLSSIRTPTKRSLWSSRSLKIDSNAPEERL